MYKIRCIRLASSMFGAATGYLKEDGKEVRFLTYEDAERRCATLNTTMASANLRYEVEEVG